MPRAGDGIDDAVAALRAAADPIGALAAARRLREASESIERDAVSAARAAGVSWSAIGRVYGLTKQGAQQRFKAPPAAE
jgi:hypothetical protein